MRKLEASSAVHVAHGGATLRRGTALRGARANPEFKIQNPKSPAAALFLLFLVGCQGDWWQRERELPPEPEPQPISRTTDPVLAGTIGEQTLFSGMSQEPLRGFGVVVGLEGKGSSDCPAGVRDYLLEYMAKQIAPQGSGDRRSPPRITPGALLDSPDTAVVEVTGVVPPGAVAGARFDLRLQALPGTSTTSLEGGLLLVTELRYFDVTATGSGMYTGPVLALGGGPVFTNPYAGTTDPADANLRQGFVLGGGKALEPRPVKLALLQPNYGLARNIERRINERFGKEPPAASAMSRGYLVLATPREYAAHPEHFHQLLTHLYVDKDPALLERRLRDLTRLAATRADPEPIALAWEGLGRIAIPHVQPFYAHVEPGLRFYAARAGLRVGDTAALPVVADLAGNGPRSLRLLAVRELGASTSAQAPLKLAPLLADPDQEIRIAAYEALLEHGHPAIQTLRFPHALDPTQLNFCLDIVDAPGASFVYVRRTRVPRIAVFGRQTALLPPVFYTNPDDALTVHTVDGSDDVRVFARRGRQLSDELAVPPRIVDVIIALADLPLKNEAGRIRGIGLPYARVVQVLAELARTDTLPAPVVIEQTTLTDLLGPELAPERPETDTLPAESRPAPAGSADRARNADEKQPERTGGELPAPSPADRIEQPVERPEGQPVSPGERPESDPPPKAAPPASAAQES